MTPTSDTDFVVVGAGISGLVAAKEIEARGERVVVFEARDRVGGRIFDVSVRDEALELGATYFTEAMPRITALAASLGLDTHPQFAAGATLIDVNGEVRREDVFDFDTVLRGDARTEHARARQLLGELASGVPPAAPWTSPNAEELDCTTVAAWFDETLSDPDVRAFLTLLVSAYWAATPEEVSLLGFLEKISSAGGVEKYPSTEADSLRFVEGPSALTRALAEGLEDAVRLNAPATEIRQDEGGIEVTANGVSVRARRCVVAVPPPLVPRIAFDPPLPGDYAQLLQRLPFGAVVRTQIVFAEPFWREDGLSGHVNSTKATFGHVYDSSPASESFGAISTLTGGRRARELALLDGPARREAVLSALPRYFGEGALEPEDYFEIVWADEEWTRGGYSSLFMPGALTGFRDRLREPFGRVHWAGTETATEHYGAMEGAIQSGERAAGELLEADRGG